MNTITTMTKAGQITIPESIRTAAGMMPGAPLEVSANNGVVLIKEHKPPKQLDPDRFDKMRGTAPIKWRTDELMATLRGDDN